MGDTPESPPTVEPITVVVCDDIRQEINGKQILIGVYSEDIIVPSVPIILGLCFWFQVRRKGKQEDRAVIRIKDPSGNTAGEATLNFKPVLGELLSETTGAVFMPQLALTIAHPGTIDILWSRDGTSFSLIDKKRVKTGHIALPADP